MTDENRLDPANVHRSDRCTYPSIGSVVRSDVDDEER